MMKRQYEFGLTIQLVGVPAIFVMLLFWVPLVTGSARANPTTVKCVGCDTVKPSLVASFEQTLAKHLQALRERDLAAYASTLNRDTTLLLPSGKLYRGKSAVVAFHRKFLADHGWTQDFEKIREMIHPCVALAFFRVVYRDRDKTGKVVYESHFLMSLTFVRENGRWQLINDQVTKPPQ